MTLSPEMQRCLDFVRANDGQIHRHPGGFWAARAFDVRSGAEHFGTTTVEALVSRGVLVYSQWKENRAGRFPTQATLSVEKPEVTS